MGVSPVTAMTEWESLAVRRRHSSSASWKGGEKEGKPIEKKRVLLDNSGEVRYNEKTATPFWKGDPTMRTDRFVRALCLFLACFLLLLPLASCGGGETESASPSHSASESESATESESESETQDKWANVDFGGAELKYNISVAKSTTSTYDAADKYIRDPDLSEADEVLKKVYDRNAYVRETLGITVEFEETDAIVTQVLGVIEKLFLLTEDDAPDIFNNDVYDILHASYRGMLWNLADPGEDAAGNPVVSHFDFDHPSWHKDYMLGPPSIPRNCTWRRETALWIWCAWRGSSW